MTENQWEILGRFDIVFGILGGIGMIWTGAIYLFQKFAPRLLSTGGTLNFLNQISHTKILRFFLLENAIKQANKSIRYILLISLVFAVLALFDSPSGLTQSIKVLIDSFAAIFIGLAIGSWIESTRGRNDRNSKVITGAVIGAFAFSTLFVLMPTVDVRSNGSTGEIIFAAGFGAVIGAFFMPIYLRVSSMFINEFGSILDSQEQDSLTIKSVRKPIETVTTDGLKVTIEVVVQNNGHATSVYPHLEFKVAELKGSKFQQRVIKSSTNLRVDLPANTECIIPFSWVLSGTTKLLLDPPNKVTVKLHRKPNAR